MKWTPLHTAALVAVVSLSVLPQLRVSADQPSSQAATPIEPGIVNSQQQSASALSNSTTSLPPAPNRHSTRGQYLARTALSYRGLRYRWGGTSPRSGFDCSGLVQVVCRKWGILVPRVARAQFKMGVPVKPDKLEPGDLVFFQNTYRRGLSHVGIYIGNGCFVHAAGVHKGVMISRLDSGYHKKHWAGARRLNLSKLPPVPGEEEEASKIILDTGLDPNSPTDLTAPGGAPGPPPAP